MNNFIWKDGYNKMINKLSINPTINQEYETDVTFNGKKVFYKYIQQDKRISGTSQELANGIGCLINQDITFFSTLDNIKYFMPYTHTNGAIVYLKLLANGSLQIVSSGTFSGNYRIQGMIFYTKV